VAPKATYRAARVSKRRSNVLVHILLKFVFVLQREAEQGVRAFEAQLAADVGAVVFYGSVVDGKLCSNLLARLVGGDQPHDPAQAGDPPACFGKLRIKF
jgi:hypothetical protein